MEVAKVKRAKMTRVKAERANVARHRMVLRIVWPAQANHCYTSVFMTYLFVQLYNIIKGQKH